MRHIPRLVFVVAALVIVADPASAQRRRGIRINPGEKVQSNAFEWSGELGSGNRIILRNLNGSVHVERANGRTLEVTAEKRWRKGDPADVRITAARVSGRDVLVCAAWTDQTRCTETSYSVHNTGDNNDVQVHFTVRLPAGADAVVSTTNGEIEIVGATGDVDAHTTNGSVIAESNGGTVEASTTNGDVEVSMAKLPARGASYSTTNGSVTVTLPDGIDANVVAQTTNGRVVTDFQMMVSGSVSTRSLRGTIGRGGPVIRLSTTNGDVRLEKR
jgi:hypothetical protein